MCGLVQAVFVGFCHGFAMERGDFKKSRRHDDDTIFDLTRRGENEINGQNDRRGLERPRPRPTPPKIKNARFSTKIGT